MRTSLSGTGRSQKSGRIKFRVAQCSPVDSSSNLNTVYLEQAVAALERQGTPVPTECLPTFRRLAGNTSISPAIISGISVKLQRFSGCGHVGLGSDFDGADMPEGVEDCSRMPRITQATARQRLFRWGYSKDSRSGDANRKLGDATPTARRMGRRWWTSRPILRKAGFRPVVQFSEWLALVPRPRGGAPRGGRQRSRA